MGKKEAKNDKMGVDKIVKKVNKEFDKTSSQIESLMNDALKRFDKLQNQIQEPVKKLIGEMERLREREIKRFQEEFDRRMSEFQDMQSNLLDKVGLGSEKGAKTTKTPAKKSPSKKPAAKKAPAKKAATKKKATTSKKSTTAKKTSSAKPAASASKASDTDLTRIKGIGPATAKKMQAQGITKIQQVASPNATEQKVLESFSNMKGSDQWQAEAKKLVS